MLWVRLALAAAAVAAFGQTPSSISADALRVHVSYLASDVLKGRDTPSPELDTAAGYIVSQFQRAGLAPAGDEGYFQTVHLKEEAAVIDGFYLSLGSTQLPPDRISILHAAAVDTRDAPVSKIGRDELAGLKNRTAERQVLLLEGSVAVSREILRELIRLRPVALLVLTPFPNAGLRNTRQLLLDGDDLPGCPILLVSDTEGKLVQGLPSNATATLRMAAPNVRLLAARNVVGMLRGSEAELRDTYLVLSAHYDHLGQISGRQEIFHGANDDASGVASVIELAVALATGKHKRSILFIVFCGEEKGLLGSQYYVRHPLLPLDKTVAVINLELMGRTDDSQGQRVSRGNVTGFDYSNLGHVLAEAGRPLGVEFSKEEGNSDSYFRRADNFPFAQAGIPAHTVSVTYMFTDYHKPDDKWQKLDYENMARVNQAVAAGVFTLSNDPEAPKWSIENPKTEPFRNLRP